MKNLESQLKTVWEANGMLAKQCAMIELIDQSHAKKDTKVKAYLSLKKCNTMAAIDKFAVNYMMSGEGMKV